MEDNPVKFLILFALAIIFFGWCRLIFFRLYSLGRPKKLRKYAEGEKQMEPQGEVSTLIRKARVRAGDYGSWKVGPEHDGIEIWIVFKPPKHQRFRNPLGAISEGLVYQRLDGLVARAEYLELTDEFAVYDPNSAGHA